MAEPTTTQQPDLRAESRILSGLGFLATESLQMSWSQGKTHFYLMTPNLYTETSISPTFFGGKMSINNFASGMRYSEGIDKFVAEAIADPKCGGLVPVTEEALKILNEKHKLRVVARGLTLQPENVRFDAYGK